MYKCTFCGYKSDVLEDFEEDFTNHKGYWCPCCDGFMYLNENEKKHNFKLIFEIKSQKEEGKCKNAKIKTQVSPLRWPGGKSKVVAQILDECDAERMECFVEPFAGGASVGLSLLLAGKVKELYLNDVDFGVYSLFYIIKNFPWMIIDEIRGFEPSEEAYKEAQSVVLSKYKDCEMLDAAKSLLVCNRLAFSGIPKANCMKNPGARWNPDTLVKRIIEINRHAEHIHISCMDACELIEEMYWHPNTTIFIDPPYVDAGKSLYVENYNRENHSRLACLLDELYKGMPGADMILTYDNNEFIREMYQYPFIKELSRRYSVAN